MRSAVTLPQMVTHSSLFSCHRLGVGEGGGTKDLLTVRHGELVKSGNVSFSGAQTAKWTTGKTFPVQHQLFGAAFADEKRRREV